MKEKAGRMLHVDHAARPMGRMRMSHLMADSRAELERTRLALGLPSTAVHHAGEPTEHLDVSESKRNEAIRRLGAQEVSSRDLVRRVQRRRAAQNGTAKTAGEGP